MDITFIVTNQQRPYEGVVRPFLNFKKALEGKYTVSFALLNCSNDFFESLSKNNFQVTSSKTKKGLIEEIKRIKPNFVFTDDDINRLRLAMEIKRKTNSKAISYVQVLYGSHAIANCFDMSSLTLKERLIFSPIKHIPFSFFSSRYAKILRDFDIVIANSKVTATFLKSIYDVELNGIVYAPIDMDLFQPKAQKNRKEVVLYLGSHLGDTKQDFIRKIICTVVKEGYFVNIFGNPTLASRIIKTKNDLLAYHSKITDVELADLYSRSKLTICPQKWEQFGLVPVESMACGTPVLAFNCMGFQETILDKKTGWLADNDSDFLQILSKIVEESGLSLQEVRSDVLNRFSICASGASLIALLEKYFN